MRFNDCGGGGGGGGGCSSSASCIFSVVCSVDVEVVCGAVCCLG